MRLDKFLKVSRLVKRRTVAKDFADHERVLVNGRVAKPATEVRPGDVITIQFGVRKMVVEVLELKESVRAADAAQLYRTIEQS
ncbi:MAG TPA: RNA-binding S4 domain-containing protein [Syntrophothermus lipocalidus]|uniref:RQC P-site tRNA stabilizing factor n=1 Tax=Syntrophothermus lipocalidus (strain DSM 12680 / TGB-C1) TaxID=643648 RepID=D7CIP8_SYNLT|nr:MULTISPECIES: RNA-binding S4 domain-containing protein [Syntrophothermus]ADI00913.1 RNA-binding S4 domain protein [Syntrophothermus lipocalidus DSM 12680]NSW84156.1 RNA-binding S4 domain-containing protein [Syntrophothermus sp.]HHV77243.1 RNA-binding S4 domain-containing protein [Syntrophothermus lipocalidus]HOV42961.1 RNA-binding S4 domain-containing protein [Syntrophothermus lipocalidus]